MDQHDTARPDDLKTPPVPPSAATTEIAPVTIGAWFRKNGLVLGLILSLLVFLYIQFDWYGLFAICKAALGLSFVIFIHELGHFLTAKWCDVHVTTFSIGFGPALPGCSFKWGETTYKLGLLPLGGYVQMVGQVDGDEGSDDSEDDPRSYRNKGVGQRMLIISAGVIMNVILAIVCFVVVFRGPGKDRLAGVVADIDSGSAAFQGGIRTGSEIERIGNINKPHFEQLINQVMSTHHGEELDFVFKRQEDQQATEIKVEPRKGDNDLKPMIGIAYPNRLELETRTHLAASMERPVYPGSAASKAEPGFKWGDKIIGMTDPITKKVAPLPVDERVDKNLPNYGQKDYFVFWRRMVDLAGQNVTIQVERDGQPVDIVVPPAYRFTLGTRMEMGQISEIRRGSTADHEDGLNTPQNGLEGDVILEVEVQDPDQPTKPLRWADKILDPERLPYELRQWANRMAKAAKPDWTVKLMVRRHRSLSGTQYDNAKQVTLTWDDTWKYDRVSPLNIDSPLPIPELGLAYRIKATVDGVNGDLVKDNALQRGDIIKEVRLSTVDPKDKEKEVKGPWVELKLDQWAWFSANYLQRFSNIKSVSLKVSRNKEEKDKEIDITALADKNWPSPELGLIFQRDLRRQKASSLVEAVELGVSETYDNVTRVFLMFRSMYTGRASPKLLSGPITIARFAYLFAKVDSWEFVFFLGMISISLAVINFLPIPVLDGGHMVFLIYEKLRGKPASEGVRISATYAGLFLILCLMVFVFYNDISGLFG